MRVNIMIDGLSAPHMREKTGTSRQVWLHISGWRYSVTFQLYSFRGIYSIIKEQLTASRTSCKLSPKIFFYKNKTKQFNKIKTFDQYFVIDLPRKVSDKDGTFLCWKFLPISGELIQ